MDHLSEQEQIEELKKWWKANGPAIVAGIVIGLGAIFGWRGWTAWQNARAEEASQHYDTLATAIDSADAATAREQGRVLLKDFPDSPYAMLAALMLAKLEVKEGDSKTAIDHLQQVIERAKQEEMKSIARLRLARVLLAADRLDDAELQLEQINEPSFIAEVEELKGDLYTARKEPDKARRAYQLAQTSQGGANSDTMLELKLNDLPPPAQTQ